MRTSALAAAASSVPGKVFAGDPVRAVSWGGQWLDSIKEVTDQQSAIDVAWFAFRSGSSEILALTSAVWPKTPFDISASWAPHFVKMHNSEWLEEITPDEVPNLADIPDSMLVHGNKQVGVHGIPYSVAGIYWGYRKDMVDIEIKSIEDLLHPSLKGKICITSPTLQSNMTVLSMAMEFGGDEANMDPGWEFQKELAKSGNLGRIAASDVDMINSINTGETAVSFMVTANWNSVKENHPCQLMTKAPTSKGMKTFMITEGFCIFKGERSADAKALMNHMLSPESNQAYNFGIGQGPVNSKSKSPPQAADIAMSADELAQFAYFPDFVRLGDDNDAAIKYWETEIQPLIRAG
jgi:putative spermidine/putrescine transport system substrate-binding protein